ncbi:MAG TPA: aldolase/citrate lyase family protein [Burkholderiales bacterium]|nr:aldolase/citrate lyase family protein [Burkholderiales bacterium]
MNPANPATQAMRKWRDPGRLFLCMGIAQARTADIIMLAAACGYDAISVDLEHTATSLESASLLCTAALGAGLLPMVRVPSHDASLMTRVLDTGAIGLTVPHVDSREEAERIVAACKFPPEGRRSIVGPTPLTQHRPMPLAENVAFLNQHMVIAVMLETPEAIARAGEIAAVPGVDMLLIGPADLTAELGILGEFRHARFREAMAAAAAACRMHGKVLGIAGVSDLELLRDYIAMGLRFINAGNDAGFMVQAGTAQAVKLRGLESPGKN